MLYVPVGIKETKKKKKNKYELLEFIKSQLLKYSKMYWLIVINSKLSTYNKLLIYKQVLKPVWTYGMDLENYCKCNMACEK